MFAENTAGTTIRESLKNLLKCQAKGNPHVPTLYISCF